MSFEVYLSLVISTLPTPGHESVQSDGAVVAVLELEDRGVRLDHAQRSKLGEDLAALLAQRGRYRVVPPAELKRQVQEQDLTNCRDDECRREIGKEVAADKILATRVMRIGWACRVAARLYDLQGSRVESVEAEVGPCGADELRDGIKVIVERLGEASARGCSTMDGRLTLDTRPSGARVLVNDKEIGTTPIHAHRLPADCLHKLHLVAPDGRERTEMISLLANKISIYKIKFDD